jgi:hypothetical protein
MYEQEVAARPRDRKVLTPQEITKATFAKLQENDSDRTPIVEVLNILSINKEGGHITYSTLTKKAQEGTLLEFDRQGRPTSTLQNLSSAYAEAIALKSLRDNTGRFESAVFEPVTQARNATDQASSSSNWLYSLPGKAGRAILDSFANKTPDILFTVPRVEIRTATTDLVTFGKWGNIVDPKDPTNTKRLLEYKFRDQNLFSPVEVTVSGRGDEINKKVKKFKDGYRNPFPGDKSIAYVPVLVMDYGNYENLPNDTKQDITNKMRQLGGFVSLVPGLLNLSNKKAIEAATQLTSAMQSRRKELDENHKQEVNNSLTNKKLYFAEKLKSEDSLILSKAWLGGKANFKNLLENFNFALKNKPQETTNKATANAISPKVNNTVSQKESAAETYKRVTSNIKFNPSYFQKIGVVNSDHIDLVIAIGAIKSGLDPVELLKQSPTYQAKMPVLNKMWLNKVIHDAKGISEEAPDSANFQKAIKKYDAKKTKAQSNQKQATNTNPTKRLAAEVYQEMTSLLKETASYSQDAGIDVVNNSNHLDLMLAKQLMRKDIDYETILRQSPNYRSKEPAEANSWLKNIIKDGISMNKEYYLDSDGSQKIIRSYDNDASRPQEKSDFEKLSKSIQGYNSSYSTDRGGLLVAVATAAIKAGMNPEQVLRQDPKYSANEKSESLVEKTIEKAESAVQAEKSRIERQAQRDSQRDRGREL